MHLGISKSKTEKEYKAIPWQECLAKLDNDDNPGAKVFEHCILSYHVGKYLLKFINESVKCIIPKNILFIIGTHDVGKVSPGFSIRICTKYYFEKTGHISYDNEFEWIHSVIGEASLKHILGDFSVVAGGHHGIRKDSYCSPENVSYGGKSWENERQGLISAIKDYIEKDGSITKNPKKIKEESIPLVLAITTISDWIASNSYDFDQSNNPLALENNIEKVPKIVDDIIEKIEIKNHLTFRDIFPKIKKINKLQKACSKIKDGKVIIIEDSMGGGKTEASFFLSYLLGKDQIKNGVYYALPTKITSNYIYRRVEDFIKSISTGTGVNLVHGDSWMIPKHIEINSCEDVPRWYDPSKRALLSKFGVGTIDQCLMSILNVKHNYLRLYGLTGKIVIFDEVHSYDAYTSTILFKLIAQLKKMGCIVIILSATLNTKTKEKILGKKISKVKSKQYPLITYIDSKKSIKYLSFPKSRNIKVKTLFGDINYEEALNYAYMGYKILVIRNTSGKAQDSYMQLMSLSNGSVEIGLLHAKFTNEIRVPLENKYVGIFGKNSTYDKGFILVATQVVEQSLDIDSDYMYTDFCPSDLLLQRLGRLWRHERKRPHGSFPCVTIIMPEMEDGEYKYDIIYDKYICSRSMEVLSKYNAISLPDDIRKTIETTYCERKENGIMLSYKKKLEQKSKTLEDFAIGSTKKFMPMSDDDEKAFTRFSNYPTRSLALVKDCKVVEDSLTLTMLDGSIVNVCENMDKDEKIKLCRNVVTVPFSRRRLQNNYHSKENMFSEKICKNIPYNIDSITIVSSDGNMFYDKGKMLFSGLAWSNSLGVYKINDEDNVIG